MSSHNRVRRWLRFAALLVFVLLIGGLAVRPAALRWGATDAEVSRSWSGDELLARVQSPVTRAVTVHASAEAIWPWFLQIGQDRGGFYSYTALENLIGLRMKNVYRVVPEFQQRAVGDTVWFGPKDKFGGQARMIVAELVPNRAMVFVMPADYERLQRGEKVQGGIWSFLLQPIDAQNTRLVMRTLSGGGPVRWRDRMVGYLFWDPAHFVMERRMMLTIRELAERRS